MRVAVGAVLQDVRYMTWSRPGSWAMESACNGMALNAGYIVVLVLGDEWCRIGGCERGD
jgi:hypothetical protein